MMLLDTNILSEMMRPKSNADVIFWLNQQDTQSLFVSSISVAEIRYGLCTMGIYIATGQTQTAIADSF